MEKLMPLSPAQMDQKIDEHFNYEVNDDVEGVLKTLADDATHDVIGWPSGPSRGRDEARQFYETLFSDLDDGKVTNIRRLYGENFVVDESRWEGRATGRPFGMEGNNRPLSFRLLHVVNFTQDGQFQKEQVWIDFATLMQQLQAPA